jgi:hypothetical protein
VTAAPAAALPAARSRLHLGKVELRVQSAKGVDWPTQWSDSARFGRETGATLEELLEPLLDPADPSVWIIRRLALSAIVDGGDAGQAARCFGLALRGALKRALHGEEGQGIIRFADRAAYLARLLADVARGDGFDRWYHFRYAYLRPLPVAQALSQAIAANRDHALKALAVLDSDGELAGVIAALEEAGAGRVLDMLAAGPREAETRTPVEAHLALETVRASTIRWRRGARLRLALLVVAARRSGLPTPVILAAIDDLIDRDQPIADQRAPPSEPHLDVEHPSPQRRSMTPAGPAPQRIGIASAARSRASRSRSARQASLATSIETPFAGLFLLWRSVVELGLERLLPDGSDGAHARLTLAATFAGRHWRGALADPALHWLTGCDPAEEATPAEPDPQLPATFAAHMAAHAAPRTIQLAGQQYARFRVTQDASTEEWLELARGESDKPNERAMPGTGSALRPIARDLGYFGLLDDDPPHPSWVLLARAAFGDLGRRLPGLERSSAAYLAANIVIGKGQLDLGVEAEVTLPRAPLDLVLRMTGIDGTTVRLADGRSVFLRLPRTG